jgi:hypothetical protein
MSDPADGANPAPASSFWRSLKTVAWSFLGIRKQSESQEDLARVNPFHIVAAGLVGVLIFVVGLIVLVNWVVAK